MAARGGPPAILTLALGVALSLAAAAPAAAAPAAAPRSEVDAVAEAYVKLVLALGRHDPDYVDAYYGPAAWQRQAEAHKRPLADLRAEAERLVDRLDALGAGTATRPPAALRPGAGPVDLALVRRRFLRRHLQALATRAEMLAGKRLSFDEESRVLYDAVAPRRTERQLGEALAQLDRLVPGKGPLPARYEAYRKRFEVPAARLPAVFQAAVEACRGRTRAHLPLPTGEKFAVEYVTGKPWGAYNWYKGGFTSVIQVNTDQPMHVDAVLDTACHEGYPGHHVQNVLLEKLFVRDRGWIELAVYPLHSPQSLLAEGTAEHGIEVAFPEEEKRQLERQVLFPLAGLDPATADNYYRVRKLLQEGLRYASTEGARLYVDGAIDRERYLGWLTQFLLMPRPRAEQRVKFTDRYRSYLINYEVGEDLVRAHVRARVGAGRSGVAKQAERDRWAAFGALLTTPWLPSDLGPPPAAGAPPAASPPRPSQPPR